MNLRAHYELVISGLPPDAVRSLTGHLGAAAIVATGDVKLGRVVVSRGKNRIFGVDDIIAVVGEWLAADAQRHAYISAGSDVGGRSVAA
jgi:hypothetical protein